MWGLLARFVSPRLVTQAIGLPWLKVAGIAVVAFIGVREVQHWREVRGLQAVIETVRKELAAETLATVTAQKATADERALRTNAEKNAGELAAKLDAQTATVRRLQTDSAAALKDAELAALRALALAPLPDVRPSDAEGLNAAIAELQGGAK